ISTSLPATPSWAAPKATNVATSKLRTRIRSSAGSEVRKRNCRLAGSSKAGSGTTHTRCNSGMNSPRMRPFGKAMISGPISVPGASARTSCRTGRACGSADITLPRSARGRQLVAGLPRCRPGIAEIPGANAQRRGGQANLRVAGEIEGERQARCRARVGVRQADGQQAQDAIFLAALETAIGGGEDVIEGDGAERPRERPAIPSAGTAILPTEAIGDQQEDARVWIVGKIAHRDQRVLQTGRNHREVLRILGAQPQRRHFPGYRTGGR